MTIYTNTFEGGVDGDTITVANSGGASGTPWPSQGVQPTTGQRWRYDAASALQGAMGAKRTLDATSGYMRGDDAAASGRGIMRRPLTIEATPTASLVFAQVRTATDGFLCNLILEVGRTAVVAPRGNTLNASRSGALTIGQTYWFELAITPGATITTGRVEYRITDLAGTEVFAYDTGSTASIGYTDPPARYRFGGLSTACGWTADAMDVVRYGTLASGWVGGVANAGPVVDAGVDQNVAAAASVSVTAASTDLDGTIASRLWTFDYPTSGAPALTGATTATATFTAGSAGALYVLRHTATDDMAETGFDIVEVRVSSSASIRPLPVDGTKVGTWALLGAATTDGAALADELDTTYIQSPIASGVEATATIRLAPSTVRSSGVISVKLAQDAAGAMTTKVRLRQGGVMLQEWTVATTTTPTSTDLSLSAPTVAAITDWGNLYLEFSAVA